MIQKARLSGIIEESITDGQGIRYTIFFQGCRHKCYNCHNEHTHDINGGYLKDISEIVDEVNYNLLLDGITFSGGEPFLQVDECYSIVTNINAKLSKICYTGYLFEELMELSKMNEKILDLLNELDYLIDGKYMDNLKSLSLRYKGSSNQRIIDLKKTLVQNKIVLAIL